MGRPVEQPSVRDRHAYHLVANRRLLLGPGLEELRVTRAHRSRYAAAPRSGRIAPRGEACAQALDSDDRAGVQLLKPVVAVSVGSRLPVCRRAQDQEVQTPKRRIRDSNPCRRRWGLTSRCGGNSRSSRRKPGARPRCLAGCGHGATAAMASRAQRLAARSRGTSATASAAAARSRRTGSFPTALPVLRRSDRSGGAVWPAEQATSGQEAQEGSDLPRTSRPSVSAAVIRDAPLPKHPPK
jgi:hypothetical protein